MCLWRERWRFNLIENKSYALVHSPTGFASVTIAIPGFLEILPLGASKAKGLRRLLTLLSIKDEEVRLGFK